MKKLTNITELAQMLRNDQPISKDGFLLRDLYADFLKNNSIIRNDFTDLSIEIIPGSLELFPQYPNFISFVSWVQRAGIDTQDFYDTLFIFLNEKWTEVEYPDRKFERLSVIGLIAGKTKHLSSFEWVEKTSPLALYENFWVKYDIKYILAKGKKEKEDTLLEIMSLSSNFQDNFWNTFSLMMLVYLKDFSVDELLTICKSRAVEIGLKNYEEITNWISLFRNEEKTP